MSYRIEEIFDQAQLRWIALIAQKNRCSCGKLIDLKEGQLHHALLSRQDVRNHPQAERIHHPYNVLLLHDLCHEKMSRNQACKLLMQIYGKEEIEKWYYSFPWKSSFRKLEAFTL